MPSGQYWNRAADEEVFLAQQRDKIREDLTRRLRHVCRDFSDDDFGELIDKMADRKLKAQSRGSS